MTSSTIGTKFTTFYPRLTQRARELSAFLTVERTLKARGGGYFQKNWVGVCGMLPETLTLFKAKICDFPYPISDLTLKSIPYFIPAL